MRFWELMIFVSCLVNCTTVSVTEMVDQVKSKDASCDLPIFFDSKTSEAAGFVELCQIQANIPLYPWTDNLAEEAIKIAMPLACSCGGDGILVSQWEGERFHRRFVAWVIRPGDIPHNEVPWRKEKAIARLVCEEGGGQFRDGQCSSKKQHRKAARFDGT